MDVEWLVVSLEAWSDNRINSSYGENLFIGRNYTSIVLCFNLPMIEKCCLLRRCVSSPLMLKLPNIERVFAVVLLLRYSVENVGFLYCADFWEGNE